MLKRAWVTAKIGVEIEYEVKHDKDGNEIESFAYIDELKSKLKDADITDIENTELDEKTIEYYCEICDEWKDGSNFYAKQKTGPYADWMCIDCSEKGTDFNDEY